MRCVFALLCCCLPPCCCYSCAWFLAVVFDALTRSHVMNLLRDINQLETERLKLDPIQRKIWEAMILAMQAGLQAIASENQRYQTAMEVNQALEVPMQFFSALSKKKRGLLHLQLKPAYETERIKKDRSHDLPSTNSHSIWKDLVYHILVMQGLHGNHYWNHHRTTETCQA